MLTKKELEMVIFRTLLDDIIKYSFYDALKIHKIMVDVIEKIDQEKARNTFDRYRMYIWIQQLLTDYCKEEKV